MRLPTVLRGIAAGAAGTAAMTAHQHLRQRLSNSLSDDEHAEPDDPWQSAPAPAQVGKRLIEKLFRKPVPASAIPLLTQVMHWSYGTTWGAAYAIVRASLPGSRPWKLGSGFGMTVWASSYAQLVPAGIYKPPWQYPPGSIADEIGYHLTYGTVTAFAYDALART